MLSCRAGLPPAFFLHVVLPFLPPVLPPVHGPSQYPTQAVCLNQRRAGVAYHRTMEVTATPIPVCSSCDEPDWQVHCCCMLPLLTAHSIALEAPPCDGTALVTVIWQWHMWNNSVLSSMCRFVLQAAVDGSASTSCKCTLLLLHSVADNWLQLYRQLSCKAARSLISNRSNSCF